MFQKYSLLMMAVILLTACTKMDHSYAPYLENGEQLYPGVPYKLETHAGRGRIEVQFTQSKDPDIVKYVLYWNNRQQKQEVIPDKQNAVMKVIVPGLDEGDYTFEIVSMYRSGNSSTPKSAIVSGRALGSRFESELFIRKIRASNCRKGFALQFFEADASARYTDVTYKDAGGTLQQKRIAGTAASFDTLENIHPSAVSLVFRTAYLPDKCIDTFYAEATVPVNPASGSFVCTGTMTDYTNASLTGPYPWNVTLRQTGALTLEMVDDDQTHDVFHKILSNGSPSYYGSFGLVFTLDAANNVTGVVNKHGQPSSNGRSAQLDPSGVNKYDPVAKVLQVKYWMNQPGETHRTLFDETMTMK
ncbi:DUF4998 domain-containing protein [Chitinophaga rhizosphaerae]|uniref:DUF4998 domain-containing protein n=1 Tax=Chitinophaga rhizosphaerae TaxID=1864947 RepID=UPI000F810545|nr:DUF4998 domain-containing protein [Chitinophaga rhizosphaerae]